jgi:quercetin dioxygenase-like cupin family protein
MSTTARPAALVVRAGQGDSRALLSSRYSVLAASEDTDGALCVIEMEAPASGAPPVHRHEADAEGFLVLAGSMDVLVEGETTTLQPGDFAWIPAGVAHSFAPAAEGVRALVLAAPGGFERFVRAAGTPCAGTGLPAPSAPPDPAAMAALAAEHGITILGPPPGA